MIKKALPVVALWALVSLVSGGVFADGIDISGAPVIGPAEADVQILEFSDFQCPYCARMSKTLEKWRKAYPERIKIIWMDRPLVEEVNDGLAFHPYAMTAHEAAAEAHAQGSFWRMQEYIFEHRGELFPRGRPTGKEELEENIVKMRILFAHAATKLKLDTGKMRQALKEGTHKETIMKRLETAGKLRVDSTPRIFVNGEDLGANPEVIKTAIEKILGAELPD